MVNTPPTQIFLELTSRCNLACLHCSTDYGDPAAGPHRDLEPALLERLMPWLLQARFVNLNIVGEPLLSPAIDGLVPRLSGAGVDVSFNTNGLLLNASRIEWLIESGLQSITVSLDGMGFNDAIRGFPWTALAERLEALDAAKRRLGSQTPHVALGYTLMRSNVDELAPLLRELLPRVNLHAVHLQPLVVFYETLKGENVYSAERTDACVAEARALCAEHGTELVLFRSRFAEDERSQVDMEALLELGPHSEELGCSDPFFEVKIRTDGTLDACSFGRSPGLSLLDHDLDAVWNGPWYRQLRLDLAAGRYLDTCATCPYMHGCAAHQLTPLRPGVEHSQAHRLRE